MKTKNNIYKSVLHKNCGGEIVIVAKTRNDILLVCKRCKTSFDWTTNIGPYQIQQALADEMEIME